MSYHDLLIKRMCEEMDEIFMNNEYMGKVYGTTFKYDPEKPTLHTNKKVKDVVPCKFCGKELSPCGAEFNGKDLPHRKEFYVCWDCNYKVTVLNKGIYHTKEVKK